MQNLRGYPQSIVYQQYVYRIYTIGYDPYRLGSTTSRYHSKEQCTEPADLQMQSIDPQRVCTKIPAGILSCIPEQPHWWHASMPKWSLQDQALMYIHIETWHLPKGRGTMSSDSRMSGSICEKHAVQGERISPSRSRRYTDLCKSTRNKLFACFICSRLPAHKLCLLLHLREFICVETCTLSFNIKQMWWQVSESHLKAQQGAAAEICKMV